MLENSQVRMSLAVGVHLGLMAERTWDGEFR